MAGVEGEAGEGEAGVLAGGVAAGAEGAGVDGVVDVPDEPDVMGVVLVSGAGVDGVVEVPVSDGVVAGADVVADGAVFTLEGVFGRPAKTK